MVNCYYFSHRLGKAYVVGIGSFEIAKYWFGDEEIEDSESPLSFDDAKEIAENLVAYLNENIPVTPEMAELYGDSDDSIMKITIMDKFTNGEELNDKEKEKIIGELVDICCEE